MNEINGRLACSTGVQLRLENTKENGLTSAVEQLADATQMILHTDKNLINTLSIKSALNVVDTVRKIHKLIDSIEQKQMEFNKVWEEVEKDIKVFREVEFIKDDANKVTNWILGPADSHLNDHHKIGCDIASCDELMREHEKFEEQYKDHYNKYSELLHKIDSLPISYLSKDLESQRDLMDFVFKSFHTRLEVRRNTLGASQKFFRLVSEYFDKTSEVFDQLVIGTRSCSFSHADAKLQKLKKSHRKLDSIMEDLTKEGGRLSEILAEPIKDALCREVPIDYTKDIANIKEILDATSARRNIFNDSVELQKLTLKLYALIYSYESDAEQTVQWLDDLFDEMVYKHAQVGQNLQEIQTKKQEVQTLEDLAIDTYDYGCQLVDGARILRNSGKLDLVTNTALLSRLQHAWRQLHSVGQEQLTRLRICAIFYRNVEDHCAKLREMIDAVGVFSIKAKRSSSFCFSPGMEFLCCRVEIEEVLNRRDKLLPEIGRMIRVGRLLRSRLKEPLIHQRRSASGSGASSGSGATPCWNPGAVETISAKLLEVTAMAEKLDASLCEAGAASRPLDLGDDEEEGSSLLLGLKASGVEAVVGPEGSEDAETLKALLEVRSQEFTDSSTSKTVQIVELPKDSPVDSTSLNSEYVTATECSTITNPRSTNSCESFYSCEYDEGNCHVTEEKSVKRSESDPITRTELMTTRSRCPIPEGFELTPEGETVIQQTLRNITDKVVREVTETKTHRVSHEPKMHLASYKLVNDYVNLREIQDLKRTVILEESENSLDSSDRSLTAPDFAVAGASGYAQKSNFRDLDELCNGQPLTEEEREVATKLNRVSCNGVGEKRVNGDPVTSCRRR